jgi:hypothetical protein
LKGEGRSLEFGSLLRKEATMEKSTETTEYEAPRIEDHGDLTELTAAGHPSGTFDSTYNAGEPIPPGGPGTSGP